jgi:hypothetical protein
LAAETTKVKAYTMSNLLQQAINCDDADRAAKIIQDALGIESDDVVNHCFPQDWPADRERRARYIGEWLKTEARYLASRSKAAASSRLGEETQTVIAFCGKRD